jgi:synaptosomal-associated protein 29
VHQGEQLDNIEQKTDKINADMRTSQRHLNSIKSVFGGIKNWWKGEDKKPEEPIKEPPKRESRLQAQLDSAPDHMRSREEHPALRVKSDTSGFYEDNGHGHSQRQTQKSSAFQEYDRQFNENIGLCFMACFDSYLILYFCSL